uniref:hypothetical protein n=1 Tax=Ndongobacter massiliensis TaxID=1871025 RepID=UPI000931F121|nr:hypothetical protein [Ndongobacter massiliensis]
MAENAVEKEHKKIAAGAVIAEVNGVKILEKDVDTLQQLMGEAGRAFDEEEARNRLRDELVHQQLLYFDGKEQKLDEDAEFQNALAAAKRNMLQQYTLRKLLDSVEVTEAELREQYEKIPQDPKSHKKPDYATMHAQLQQEVRLLRQQETYVERIRALQKRYEVKKYYTSPMDKSGEGKEKEAD